MLLLPEDSLGRDKLQGEGFQLLPDRHLQLHVDCRNYMGVLAEAAHRPLSHISSSIQLELGGAWRIRWRIKVTISFCTAYHVVGLIVHVSLGQKVWALCIC